MFAKMQARRENKAVAAILCLVGAFVLPTRTLAQVAATWSGGAGNWDPCPPSGDALWNTCPTVPNGNFNVFIKGGPVTQNSGDQIVNLMIDAGDSLNFITTSYLDFTGSSIVNNGTMTLTESSHLDIIGPATVTLSGSGILNLTTANTSIDGFNPGAAFINQQTIQGQGSIGRGTMAITNQGTINATSGTLNVQPNDLGITNTGNMEASSGATLNIVYGVSAPLTNTGGTIQALDGGTVILEGPTITGGTLKTTGSGVLETSNPVGPVLNNLTLAGTFIDIGTATLEGAINNTGTIELENATIYANGNVTLTGSGSVMMVGSGSQLNFITSSQSASVLTNQSTIQGAGSIGTSGLTVTNQNLINANLTTNPLTIVGDPANNTGTLEASGGAKLEIFNTINNVGGTIKALTGSTVLLEGSGTISGGTLATTGTGTIQSFGGGKLDGTTHTVTNTGAITLSSSEELYLQGAIKNTGAITLNGSCLGLTGATTLTGSGTVTMNSNACFLAFSPTNTLTNQSTIQGSGSIGDSNPMRIINKGSIIANQSSPLLIVPASTGFTNNGKLIVNAGSTLNITNFFKNLSSGTLTGGTYQVTGTLQLPGDISTNAGNITLTGTSSQILDQFSANALAGFASNAAKGSFTLAGNQNLKTSGSLSNGGTIKISNGSTLTVGGGGSYTQTGGSTTVDGTLATSSAASFPGGSLVLVAAGPITINGGSVFGNGGNLSANVTSSGTITPADSSTTTGTLTVTGAYTQNSTGALDSNIAAATQFNQLSVTGTATLGGTLNIKLLKRFVPPLSSTFKILSCGTRTGTFATVNGTGINGSEHFTVQYNSNNVTLQVVSGP